jgi:hypothetical protein
MMEDGSLNVLDQYTGVIRIMLARLGNVIYWVGCIVAALILAIDTYFWVVEGFGRNNGFWVSLKLQIVAVIVWLVGRAYRYGLAGKW